MKIVSAQEMRNIDQVTSARFGVPSLTLMENAGAAVTEHVLAEYSAAQRIVVFCGKGNNGGDGFVASRLLHQKGKTVEVILLCDPAELKGDAARMFGKLGMPAITVRSSEELKSERVQAALDGDLYLDAILGTGFKPPVDGLYADAIAILNDRHVRVVAVDIPSGADADADQLHSQRGIVARADSIVSFTAPRPAHVFTPLTKGATVVTDIGSPAEAIVSSQYLNLITACDFAPLIAPRPAESNKGNYGHVLVVGGAVGKAGSVAMAGMAALRAGAGLVTVATAKSALATVAGFYPELMTEPLPETDEGTISAGASEKIQALAKGKSVVAIGPGISRVAETAELVRKLVKATEIPVVLDADGLNAFEGRTEELKGGERPLVITPHPGEMARLMGNTIADVQEYRVGAAQAMAMLHKLIVVLKGHRTLVVRPDGEAWVNTTGNPGMSTGGTGDILTGMVAGLMAQSTAREKNKNAVNENEALLAVIAAVHLHGLAGDVMRESVGEHSMVATDLLRGLPEAFRRAQKSAHEKFVRWDG